MTLSVANGYFCANSCDAAKAKKGEDPHPSTDPGNVDELDPAIHPPRRTMDARVKHEIEVTAVPLLRHSGIDDRLSIALAAQHNHEVGDQRGPAIDVELGDLLP
jgi:hypothetical protein